MPADETLAYLGSANPAPPGAAGHAEAGVLLTGPGVAGVAGWLDAVAVQLACRRLPGRTARAQEPGPIGRGLIGSVTRR